MSEQHAKEAFSIGDKVVCTMKNNVKISGIIADIDSNNHSSNPWYFIELQDGHGNWFRE